jgi:hypothetical protein
MILFPVPSSEYLGDSGFISEENSYLQELHVRKLLVGSVPQLSEELQLHPVAGICQ